MDKLAAILLTATIAVVTVFVGCIQPSSTLPSTLNTDSAALSGMVTEAGSTTIQPLAEKLADAFRGSHPNVTITVQGGGSSVGVKSAADGTVDIGAASRELKPDEPQLARYLLAHSGLAIVTHPSNTLSGLTKDDLRRIFTGEIRGWSEVGGPDEDIIVVAREEGSGTRDAFESIVMKGSLVTKRAILQQASGAIRTIIALTPNSIGFLSFGYVDSSVKALAIDGAEANAANIVSGSYTISQPLYFLTREQTKGLPGEFINFCLSPDGQSIVESEGYISIK